MKRSLQGIGMLLLGVLLATAVHAQAHRTLTTLEQDSFSMAIFGSIQFTNRDLENVMSAIHGDSLRLGGQSESALAGVRIRDYVKQHFTMEVNDVPVSLSYAGRESDELFTDCFVEFLVTEPIRSLRITNTLLLEHFPDQQNLFEFEMNGWQQSFVFNKDSTVFTLTP